MSLQLNDTSISCGVHQMYNFCGTEINSKNVAKVFQNLETQLYYNARMQYARCGCVACRKRLQSDSHLELTTHRRIAFVIFSNIEGASSTACFVKFIREKGVGDILESSSQKNPNSPNNIVAYIWTLPTYEDYKKAVGY